ncbi:HAMP domain-containing histidine kinase [Planotetraspora sp. A-T 1434]|uniref:sensor histidine kinase n=1 Tax=Planotetraspora sp. A-T 1434 TaxID=2979219 RepID=UPI0021BF646F|nr:HAMP domain-containing sensor histidine kinase [Planotetraspora sp. A-T 1434]MCT9933362.1 HAMP domain-containing histidine kinase [Planotetraspora sp. A-T 1434]
MPLPWLRSRSLRARLTLIATATAALVMIPLSIAADLGLRHAVEDHIRGDSLQVARRVADLARGGHVPQIIPIAPDGIDMIMVVGPDGRIMATSSTAKDLPHLSPLRPASDTGVTHTTSCSVPHQHCVYVTAVRVSQAADSPIVYAGRSQPEILDSRLPELGLLLLVLLLGGGAAGIAWSVAGRVLRPVEALSSELEEITPRKPSSRVPEPAGNNEIARLAKTANDALARLEKSIQQQRQFAADASHELRTPIAGIRAQLEGARLHPEDTAEALEAALRDTGRLEAIVADLLLLARIGTSPETAREDVDLSGCVAGEVKRRSGRLPIRLELTPGVIVNGMRTQLCRVVTNLLDNAERHAATTVSVNVCRDDGNALLTVVNDGEQIPEGDRERIFERFYRRDAARSRSHGGPGLGLAIAREVVEAHDGTIRVEDADSSGVGFVIRLPLSSQPPSSHGAEEPLQDR